MTTFKHPSKIGQVITRVLTATVAGVDALKVEVEVDISYGLPAFNIVGLPETSVKESRERVRAAIKNSGFDFPSDRITINLAPADVKKEGASFDLPIALGILSCQGVFPSDVLKDFLIVGELSLDGKVKQTRGVLPVAILGEKEAIRNLIVPVANVNEACIVKGVSVFGADHLLQIVRFFKGESTLSSSVAEPQGGKELTEESLDFSDIKGHAKAKRALEVAASGSHNVLLIGPPGSGKTMLARRIPSILPPLTYEEALEVTKIHSICGLLPPYGGLVKERPFRAPHHTISDAALIGGGHVPRPGEVSLATHGVLFLDELPEFKRHVLDALRQPLEDGFVTVSRVTAAVTYPARFMLVGSMNPCPCGYLGDPKKACRCTVREIRRYRSRLSGPLLDRIDIHVEVPPLSVSELSEQVEEEPSLKIRERVVMARKIQQERFREKNIYANSQMTPRLIRRYCATSKEGMELLTKAGEKLGLSPRSYHKILKLSRTIADLDGKERIETEHVAEALQYRVLDRRMMEIP